MRHRVHAYLTAENLRCPELDLYTKTLPRIGPFVTLLLQAEISPITRCHSGRDNPPRRHRAGESLAHVAAG